MLPEREVDHSPPSFDDFKNEWSLTSTPYKYLHGVDRENFFVATNNECGCEAAVVYFSETSLVEYFTTPPEYQNLRVYSTKNGRR
jgi:hypothetical protein